MAKKVRKIFRCWQTEKEEKWLNDMAQQGWVLSGFCIAGYTFESCKPGKYIIRMDMLKDSCKSQDGRSYIDLVCETGAEAICSADEYTVYFVRESELGEFALYSDNQSRAQGFRKLLKRERRNLIGNGIITAIWTVDAILNRETYDIIFATLWALPFAAQLYICFRVLQKIMAYEKKGQIIE